MQIVGRHRKGCLSFVCANSFEFCTDKKLIRAETGGLNGPYMVATRIICQGGLAYFTLTAAPMDGITTLFGAKMFAGANGLIAAVSQKVLFVDLRESLMPTLLHAKKIHHTRGTPLMLFSGLLVTLFFSVLSSLLAMMTLCYRFGIRELDLEWANRTTLNVYENAYRMIVNPPIVRKRGEQ